MNQQQMQEYNCLDCTCTFEIRDAIWGDVKKLGYQWTYDFTLNLIEPLMYMQERGINVDFDALSATRVQVSKEIETAQEELNRICGRALNPNSPKDVQTYFYIEKGIAPYTSRSTGKITTDDVAMARLARGTASRAPMPEASLIQRLRGLLKLRGTYLDIKFDTDGRMRCCYNPRGTKFGRLSSSKTIYSTGMNMQNLPQEFKSFLRADPGYFMIEFDKRQAEWVVVAYLAQDANMIKVIEENLDPHAATAHLMFGTSLDQIKKEAKILGTSRDAEFISDVRKELGIADTGLIRNMSLRQCGKKSNHGLNYDERENMFSLSNEIPVSDAKRIIYLYHQGYPNIRKVFHDGVKTDLAQDRTLVNCFGRRITFLDRWSDDLLKAGYAFLPQSTVADCVNTGLRDIYDDTTDVLANAELLGQVHDSILMQFPLHDLLLLPAIFERCDKLMSPTLSYHGRSFTIKTDAKVGLNWGAISDLNPNGMREYDGKGVPEWLLAL